MSGKAIVSELATTLSHEAMPPQPLEVLADAYRQVTRRVRRGVITPAQALEVADMLGLNEMPLGPANDADRRAAARYHVGVRVRGRKIA